MRRPHYLKGNNNSESPQDVIWVDTETFHIINSKNEQTHILDFGFAAHRRLKGAGSWTKADWLKFDDIKTFWAWVESKLHGKCRLYVFAHNWAFDAPVLDVFRELPMLGFELKGSVINSPPVILRWRRDPHTVEMIDTLNLWRMPLKALGDSIGLPKLDMPHKTASREDWEIYGKRDVEIIMKACLRWWDFLSEHKLGGFAPTLASQAARTFRHRFMKHKILIDDNEKALELARNSLHGGRTECFYIGKVTDTVYKLDINSQYPGVMINRKMPTKLLGHYKNIKPADTKQWMREFALSAVCLIQTSKPVYGVVHNKKLVFPTGKFVAYLSTPEIKYALKHNHILKIYSCNIYEHAVLFKDYIKYFYKYRLECKAKGNDVDSLNAKLLMNSLFGKFAQRGLVYKQIDTTHDLNIKLWQEYDEDTGDNYSFRQYGGIIEELQHETESRDSHPAIAAHITAYARMQLWELITKAGRKNIFYCDTDSIWVNKTGYERLGKFLHDSDLGKLKLEGIHSDVEIYGVKDYKIDGIKRIKGIRANAIQLNNNTFEQDKFTTLVGLLRRGDLSAPIVTKITKRLRRIYNKGVVGSNGRVSPLILPADD